MATASVLPPPSSARRSSYKPIIEVASTKSKAKISSSEFDPEKHLAFKEPSKVYKMTDIGFPEDKGVSKVAVSEPFRLFSPEAVHTMRAEVLSNDVMNNCSYSSNIAACQLRGYAPKDIDVLVDFVMDEADLDKTADGTHRYSPFVYEAWKNSKTLEIISKIAGVDLVPVMDFEIGHINISVKSEQEKEKELASVREAKSRLADEGIAGCPWEDDKPIVGWHTDSYPFVCVLMLSDCSTMVGGETALRTGKGEVLRVRGPGFTPISDLSELYQQFGEYRLEILEERIRDQLRQIRERRSAGKKFDTKATKKFLTESVDFLSHTNAELVEEENVRVGYIEEVELEDVKVEGPEEAERRSKRTRAE